MHLHLLLQALKTSGGSVISCLQRRLGGSGCEAVFPATFAEYVKEGEDLFGLEDHFRHWLEDRASYEIIYVRYTLGLGLGCWMTAPSTRLFTYT